MAPTSISWNFAWALAFPRATTMRAQAAVVGSTLYLPVGDEARTVRSGYQRAQALLQMDLCQRYSTSYRCRLWSAQGWSRGSWRLRISPPTCTWSTPPAQAVVEEAGGFWDCRIPLARHWSMGTGSMCRSSASEINLGGEDQHLCCKTHGAFTALDARDGRTVWTYHTMPRAKPIRDRGDGQQMWGPSGAPIWTSPALTSSAA